MKDYIGALIIGLIITGVCIHYWVQTDKMMGNYQVENN